MGHASARKDGFRQSYFEPQPSIGRDPKEQQLNKVRASLFSGGNTVPHWHPGGLVQHHLEIRAPTETPGFSWPVSNPRPWKGSDVQPEMRKAAPVFPQPCLLSKSCTPDAKQGDPRVTTTRSARSHEPP